MTFMKMCSVVLCFVHSGIVITSMGILIGLGVIVAGANLITLAATPSAKKD